MWDFRILTYSFYVNTCFYLFGVENSLRITSNAPGDLIMENEIIKYTCDVRYAGNIIPSMTWTTSSSPDSVIPHSKDNRSGLAQSFIEITGNPSTNGQSFVCAMFFENPIVTEENVAKNAPDCITATVSVPLTVHCGYFAIGRKYYFPYM